MSNLQEYVLSLSKDTAALEAYQVGPQAAMQAAGLTLEEQTVLLSGDPQQLGRLLRVESEEGSPDSVTVAIYVYTHVKHVIAVEMELAASDPEGGLNDE